jgi:hypothetical protein
MIMVYEKARSLNDVVGIGLLIAVAFNCETRQIDVLDPRPKHLQASVGA